MISLTRWPNYPVTADAGGPPQPFSVAFGPARLHFALATMFTEHAKEYLEKLTYNASAERDTLPSLTSSSVIRP